MWGRPTESRNNNRSQPFSSTASKRNNLRFVWALIAEHLFSDPLRFVWTHVFCPSFVKITTETTYDSFEPHVLCPSFVKRNHRNNLRYVGKKCCSALSSLKGTPGTETTYDLFVVRFPALICQKNKRNNLRFVKHTFVRGSNLSKKTTETTYDVLNTLLLEAPICQNNNRNNLRCVKTTSV